MAERSGNQWWHHSQVTYGAIGMNPSRWLELLSLAFGPGADCLSVYSMQAGVQSTVFLISVATPGGVRQL
ncbi:MAG: hypothetical protein VB858_17575 [Planctomycetaceae bacterium]